MLTLKPTVAQTVTPSWWPYLTTGGSTPLQKTVRMEPLNGEQQGYIEMDLPGVLPNLGISNVYSLDANEEAFLELAKNLSQKYIYGGSDPSLDKHLTRQQWRFFIGLDQILTHL